MHTNLAYMSSMRPGKAFCSDGGPPPGESLRWLLVTLRIPDISEQCAGALTHDTWSAALNVVNVAPSHHV